MPQPSFPKISECIGAHYPYDGKIVVGEETIEIHRHFVSMISPEFHKMFHQDTKEAKTGIIEINDFDAATVRNVLDFCYGRMDTKPSIDEINRMLRFGDKYGIKIIRKRFEPDIVDFCRRQTIVLLGDDVVMTKNEKLFDALVDFLRRHPQFTVGAEFGMLPEEIQDAVMADGPLEDVEVGQDSESGEEAVSEGEDDVE